MPRRKQEFLDHVNTQTAKPTSMWALSSQNDVADLAEWDIHQEYLALAVREVTGTGAAITFSALRTGTGMSVRIMHDGAPVFQRFLDDAFDLNEVLQELAVRGKTERERKGGSGDAAASSSPPQVAE